MKPGIVDPGRFRTELTLERVVPVPDGMGGYGEDWQEIATLMARIEPVRASSRPGADQALETVTHRVTIRARAGVEAGMRFARAGRTFAIATVHDPDETGRYLVCETREGRP
ncbi:MAG: phage head closure protein [Rhizobiaceae bacterium]|nr:phage head closure protein [Rhizobiaceae bacterium]MCV0405484.1 phage head closure protein [Rhizobiaceae bacterium]